MTKFIYDHLVEYDPTATKMGIYSLDKENIPSAGNFNLGLLS